MSETKRYYWLKLNENFFDDETIGFIEEQENGKEYCLIYLKLCLKSLKNDGYLFRSIGENILPYDFKAISNLVNSGIDTVMASLSLFESMGLISKLDNGTLYMSAINEMIGTETNKAVYMRTTRLKQKALLIEGCNNVPKKGNDVPKKGNNVPNGYLEIRDKEIKRKEKDIKIKKDKYSFSFADFWSLVPVGHKKDITNCKKYFNLARKSKDFPATIHDMQISLIPFMLQAKFKYKYIKNISTWVKKGCYLDDCIVETIAEELTKDENNPRVKRELTSYIEQTADDLYNSIREHTND